MERSGTLSEPSDNSTTPYIKKETNPFGSASFFIYALVVFLQILANFAEMSGNRTGMLN